MSSKIKRDFNKELNDSNAPENEKYSYNFDFDVMYPFIIETFKPFFLKGNLLELGSYEGQFTQKIFSFFRDITCVEASSDAIQIARNKFKDKIKFYQSTFEKVILPKKYDNIILSHTLEHLEDPIKILKRINNEWLSRNGRLFLVCPNANAPSRQIAVKMGLIPYNTAVTRAEKKHGHRRTYNLDTLEGDVVKSGLNIKYRTGIFFKALANFQWDKLLKTDIISQKYLEGCYKLGHLYPDLCSSIFILCERGKK